MINKKILLLGGSAQQVVAVKTAKRMGLYTVLCDYLPDNPGQYLADRFYLVSTTDREAVLEVARKEGVSGVAAYASDPAAPTAAYVAEKLGLAGNRVKVVEALCYKDRFRAFLRSHGFNTPHARGYAEGERIGAEEFRFPVIVKPTDSSGSKGVTVVTDEEKLEEAAHVAFAYSLSKRIVVEEYIEKATPYLIGGDIFVEDGRVTLWGLMNCLRDPAVNVLVPAGKSYPLLLTPLDEQIVRTELQRLVTASGFETGAMNVEMVLDKDHRVWFIDIGPRNGGNMIPDLLGMIFDIDVVEMTIRAAMGEPASGRRYMSTLNLHSDRNGLFDGVWVSPEMEPYIVRREIYLKQGDEVRYFDNARDAVGIFFFSFPSQALMEKMMQENHRHIRVLLQGGEVQGG